MANNAKVWTLQAKRFETHWNSRCSIWGPWKEHGLGKKRWGIGIYHVCSSALSNISTMSQWEFGDCPTFSHTAVFHFSTSFCRWLCRNRNCGNCGNCWNCTYWNFMDKELSYLVYNWSWHVFPRQLGWRSPGQVPLGIQRWLSRPSYQNSTVPQLSAAFPLSPDFGWCLTAANRWKIFGTLFGFKVCRALRADAKGSNVRHNKSQWNENSRWTAWLKTNN